MSDIEEEDDFQDAQEDLPQMTAMDLDTAILESQQAIHHFFNNDFDKAKEILEPWAHCSMFHALGKSVFTFLEALLTFEQKYTEKASEALKQCIAVCSKHRRHTTTMQNISKIVKKTNYDLYTMEEIHAELCYAESLLLKAMLAFVEDETLISFVKAGLKIRNCFLSYKECLHILNTRKWENETHRIHFQSGVNMGLGTFNLMISLLPARIIKLLEFIGFSGDKNYGLSLLLAGYKERRGLRQVLCAMTLLSYNLIITFFLCHSDGDLQWCEEALLELLNIYPEGVWFLFLKAKLELIRGNIDESIIWYEKSRKSQNIWPQFHNLCYWELMWAYCIQLEWEHAFRYAECLSKKSNWSRTIYFYQQAAIMIMIRSRLTSKEQSQIDQLMIQTPTFKQRIAGKSLPMEKFVIKKAGRYFAQEKYLVLPVYELMYVWNFFRTLGKQSDKLIHVFKTIESEEIKLRNGPKNKFQADNTALIFLLKGACLRQMKLYLQAQDCLKKVLEIGNNIKEDTYLLPFATVEMALLAYDQGEFQAAACLLENAKKSFNSYSLESRLHFRIHTALVELSELRSKKLQVDKNLDVISVNEKSLSKVDSNFDNIDSDEK